MTAGSICRRAHGGLGTDWPLSEAAGADRAVAMAANRPAVVPIERAGDAVRPVAAAPPDGRSGLMALRLRHLRLVAHTRAWAAGVEAGQKQCPGRAQGGEG